MNLLRLSLSFLMVSLVAGHAAITVDCSTRQDPPLVKKIASYNAGLPPLSSYTRDAAMFDEAYTDHLRLDLGVGKSGAFAANTVGGTYSNLTYNFTNADALANFLADHNILPMYSWCYIPTPLQESNDWRNLDTNIPAWTNIWQQIHFEYARHFRTNNIPIGYHEVYNEPDLSGVFLSQTDFNNSYRDMYKYGVLGLKQGDPDAVVGGPAYAIASSIGGFMDYVAAQNLPFDFCSFHNYMDGTSWPNELNSVRTALSKYPQFRTTEIHINEFNWYNGSYGANDATSSNNFFQAAWRTLDAIQQVLARTEITTVSWAQFMESEFGDDSYGVIRKDGHRKAAFNALKIYADLPVERVQVAGAGNPLGSLAGADDHRVGVALWNTAGTNQTVSISLTNLPFAAGTFRLYRIDADNASYFNGAAENLAVVEQTNITGNVFTWTGLLPGMATLYITVADNAAPADFTRWSFAGPLGKFIRTRYYYRDRTKDNYSHVDRKTWTAWLGMGSSPTNYSLCALEAEGLPPTVEVAFATNGNLQTIDPNSVLGLRVDYRANGVFTNSVLFHAGLYNPARNAEMPWGTQRQADIVTNVGNLANFAVTFTNHAPVDWDGRVIVSWLMQNAGVNTRMRAQLTAPAVNIPGRVEAEDFVGFYDTTTGNSGGLYRATDVDLIAVTDTGGGYGVGYVAAREWLTYAVNATTTTNYDVVVRVATPNAGKSFGLTVDGTVIQASVPVPNTGGFQNWQDVRVNVGELAVGRITVKLTMNATSFNVNYLDFQAAAGDGALGTGLTGDYYDNMDLTDFAFTRLDPVISFDWGNNPPAAGLGADTFSARWTGQIRPRYSETYTFYISSDNGRRLWINNQLVIDKWLDDFGITYSGQIALLAGQKYDLRLEYFENNGGANCKLEWASASQAREVVPTVCLFPALRTSRGTSQSWLQSYFPTATDWEAADVADTDGDGLPAWMEYVAGTNPTNSLDGFSLKIAAVGSAVVVSFPTVAANGFTLGYARTYELDATDDLLSGTLTNLGQWLGTGQTVTYTNTGISLHNFYQGRVWLQPQ